MLKGLLSKGIRQRKHSAPRSHCFLGHKMTDTKELGNCGMIMLYHTADAYHKAVSLLAPAIVDHGPSVSSGGSCCRPEVKELQEGWDGGLLQEETVAISRGDKTDEGGPQHGEG